MLIGNNQKEKESKMEKEQKKKLILGEKIVIGILILIVIWKIGWFIYDPSVNTVWSTVLSILPFLIIGGFIFFILPKFHKTRQISDLGKPEKNITPKKHSQISYLPLIGTLMIIGGIMAVIYFAAFFDTSAEVPTTELLGQTIGGGRVNNLGLMADRSNGIMIGIGTSIFGLILLIATKFKSKE